jgi:hypothetical protein
MELKGKMYLRAKQDTIVGNEEVLLNKQTGEISKDAVGIFRRRVVDKSQFAKIYASEIGLLFDLSKPAINVFMYLTRVMDYDNRSYFNYYKEYTKLGYKNFRACYKGLLELLSNDIIASDVRENTYWLNPAIVCKGERFSLYTEYMTEDRAKMEAEKREKEQVKERMQNLAPEVQTKIQHMNERSEREYRAKERIQNDLFDRKVRVNDKNEFEPIEEGF